MTRQYQISDVVQTTEQFGERRFILVAFNDTGYRALSKDGKRYNITDKQIACKVAVATEDEMAAANDSYNPAEGRAHCNYQARMYPNEAEKWKYLAELKTGDTLQLVHRKTIFPAEFVCLNIHKPIYPIRAKIRGKTHDFRLEALLVK